jgi:Ca2+ transporting ATPase
MCFFGGAVIKESPMNAVQMLWVNLVQDTFAALALATEEPNEEVLKRPPYARDEYMITPYMWRNIMCQSLLHVTFLILFLFYGDVWLGIPSGRNNLEWTFENGIHYTLFFEIFVFLQLFNEVNCRKLKKEEFNVFAGFWKNPLFLIIFFGTIFVQIMLVQMGGYAMKCTPLTWDYHLFCLAIGAMSIPFQIVIKTIPESVFSRISLFKEKPGQIENLMREETFVEKLKKPSKARSFMRSRTSRADGFSRTSFHQIE